MILLSKNIENKNNVEICKCNVVHEEIIKKVKDEMIAEETLQDISDLFKVFSDSTRIKIIFALFKSEMCVCDIATLLQMNQSAISHQLRVLKQARLVKYRKEGKSVYYSLDDNHIEEIFHMALEHINEN
ncbi:ArsR/SmtB family transcription factor [Hathewaya massiliensis]|uniref:ArsR/SmtB family transcription factor n=1 Tax=Hathewaya massiliensis TaxID=1964382 RepID=UPI001157F7FC|nr:metalloregulator ArsR/SmtB family transcription factor [Hathewaya massiliensis]